MYSPQVASTRRLLVLSVCKETLALTRLDRDCRKPPKPQLAAPNSRDRNCQFRFPGLSMAMLRRHGPILSVSVTDRQTLSTYVKYGNHEPPTYCPM